MNRALLVGINTYPDAPLRGCVNDVVDMANVLVDRCHFKEREIRLLTDRRATRDGIWKRLGWLLSGVQPGDRLLFHYSGHGAQLPTRDPAGEVDGLDEVICPVEFDWSDEHAIRDKEFRHLFSSVPSGVEFVWVSDSCHSGDLSRDLPLQRPGDRKNKRLIPPADIGWRVRTAATIGVRAQGILHAARGLNVTLVPGCRSDETSSDAVFDGRPNGALTYFLLQELKKTSGLKISLDKLVHHTATALASAGYADQHPKIEGSTTIAARPFLVPAGGKGATTIRESARVPQGRSAAAAPAH